MTDTPSQREYWSGKVGDEWAGYAERIDVMLRPIAEATLELGAFRSGERVLDIGCGSGATSLEIARHVGAGGAVTGVDLSPQMLAVARQRVRQAGLKATFIEADAGADDVGAGFDAAYSRFGVMFFEAPARAFAHMRAALRPEGRLVFACWRAMADNPWATTPIAAIEPMLKAPLPAPDADAPGPHALADAEKIRRVLGEAGWRDVVLSKWDGDLLIAGGGSLAETVEFLLRIGPCARAIADQKLDVAEVKRRLMESLAAHHDGAGVALPAACWFVTARA